MADANWSKLISGGARSKSPIKSVMGLPDKLGKSFGFSGSAVLLIVAVIVIAVVAVRSSTSSTSSTAAVASVASVPVAAPETEVLHGAVAVPDVPEAPATTVQPKSSGLSRLWAADVSDLDAEQPLQDTEAGYQFEDFQRALLAGREMPETVARYEKTSHMEANAYAAAQVKPLRDMIRKSGKTVDQFVADNMITLPESLLEQWNHEEPAVPRTPERLGRPECTQEEAFMLARDSLQDVPYGPAANVNDATMVLREVLHARTEATKLNVRIPELHDGQVKACKFWIDRGLQPAADIASIVLSRA